MDNKVGKALEDVAQYISLSQLAKSLGKDKSWLYHKIDDFILKCNSTLEQYRCNTKDVFLNFFKGLRNDGTYRKRIPFTVVRSILTYTLKHCK